VKRAVRVFAVLLFAALGVQFGNSCAYAPDQDVFIQHTDPDAPYARFAAGRLGIVQTTFRIRHLVVAYNTLSGRGLSSAEQSAAVAVDNYYNAYPAPSPEGGATPQTEPPASAASATLPLWSAGPDGNDRKVPGQDWETFTNCLADTFSNANATLADRRARYGKPGAPDMPALADWIAGQQAVFTNCSGPAQAPQPAAANAPLWLRQDRAYQTAAAQFYALDYDQALAGFLAIAADHASPWSSLARYLVARVYIRKATVPEVFRENRSEQMQNEKERVTGLTQARQQLEGILRDPSMKSLHRQSLRLLDFVMLRLDPTAQASELARRLSGDKTNDAAGYQQYIIDLSYSYKKLQGYTPWLEPGEAQAQAGSPAPAQLVRWLDDLGYPIPGVRETNSAANAQRRRADAFNNWRSTHGVEWLVAALAISRPGDEGDTDLMAAARSVSAAAPAYASATYHRLRLAASPSAAVEQIPPTTRPIYDQLAELMPHIAESQPISTVNQFADLQSSLSPTLDDYLENAARRVAGRVDPVNNSVEPLAAPDKMIALCGVDIDAPETRHLDQETSLILNQRMPLRLLREAALSSVLPGNVRFQLAHMAWTRTLLLDDVETARALAPYLLGCQPAFAPWLNQYNAAPSPDERHVLGLLALMRFTSTEPTVRAGRERDFAAYDEMRDNWWCTFNAEHAAPLPASEEGPHLFTEAIVARTVQPDPPFLSAADRAQMEKEIAKLQEIPGASDYFAVQALAWVKDHPTDPHNADVIGFAMRVVRNACRSDKTKDLDHQLFDVLHRQFPKSDWAARYKTWE
jgi:hypothetical protein